MTDRPMVRPLVHLACLLSLAQLSGCDKRNPAVKTTPQAVAAALVLDDEVPPDHFLIWMTSASGSSTHWIAGDGDGIAVLAEVDGIRIPGAGGIWTIAQQTEALAGCAQEDPLRTAKMLVLSPSDGRAPISLIPAEPSATAGPWREFTVEAAVEGIFGPYLLARHEMTAVPCGDDPPTQTSGYTVVDLTEGTAIDLFTAQEQDKIADLQAALPNATSLRLTGVVARCLPQSGIHVRYRFTSVSPFAYSDGEFDRHSTVHEISSPFIPKRLVPFALTPPALQAMVLNGDLELLGWRAVGGSDADEDTLRRLFNLSTER